MTLETVHCLHVIRPMAGHLSLVFYLYYMAVRTSFATILNIQLKLHTVAIVRQRMPFSMQVMNKPCPSKARDVRIWRPALPCRVSIEEHYRYGIGVIDLYLRFVLTSINSFGS